MFGFSKDQWLTNVDKLVNEMITSDVQALDGDEVRPGSVDYRYEEHIDE